MTAIIIISSSISIIPKGYFRWSVILKELLL